MLHDHIVSFLEMAVVLLLLTNAISAAAAISAVRLLKLQATTKRAPTATERKLNPLFGSQQLSREAVPVSLSVGVRGRWQ